MQNRLPGNNHICRTASVTCLYQHILFVWYIDFKYCRIVVHLCWMLNIHF